MTTQLSDSKFDAIRNLPASDLVGVRMGWRHPELVALVAEYDAALAAQNKAELLKFAADVAARPASDFEGRWDYCL
jgi:hypothetical protein